MVNKSKARGTLGERRVLNYLLENGFPGAYRLPLSGNKDKGDLCAVPGRLGVEVKHVKTWGPADIHEWLRQTNTEAGNVGHRMVLVVINHGKPIANAWVVQNTSLNHPWFMYLGHWAVMEAGRHEH